MPRCLSNGLGECIEYGDSAVQRGGNKTMRDSEIEVIE
jgi:hypothetical protein